MGDRRFLVALALVMGIIVGTNILFPPLIPEPAADSIASAPVSDTVGLPEVPDMGAADTGAVPSLPPPAPVQDTATTVAADPVPPAVPVQEVVVEAPLYRFTFTNAGAQLTSVRLPQFPSFQREGSVELIPEDGQTVFGSRVLIGRDTLDLRTVAFEVTPSTGITLSEGDPPQDLRFRYAHPSGSFSFEIVYTFDPNTYVVEVEGHQTGLDRALLLTDLGSGLAFNEFKERDDVQVLAYVTNGDEDGIRATRLAKASGPDVLDGPFRWVAFKSKYFVSAMLAGTEEGGDARFGGVLVGANQIENQIPLAVTQGFATDGSFRFRSYMGPQELAQLASLGEDLEDVNPYGWRFIRPIVRPFSGLITRLLIWMHDQFNLAYGWVLIVFGILMRVVMFVPHHRATKAQLRNMEVQPKLKAIQEKYKNEPERLQKEMVKLYKEDGFNPFAGCLPMLIPWPVLIALFFVFQNSIELRGVPFWWLPDLSAPDPYYILPVFLGISMFLIQWIGFRSVKDQNPQMKMMMWFMPLFMMILFMNFASGLNLYYSMANIAMLPQQWFISKERLKAQEKSAARKRSEDAAAGGVPTPAPAGAKAGAKAGSMAGAPVPAPSKKSSGGKKRQRKRQKRR